MLPSHLVSKKCFPYSSGFTSKLDAYYLLLACGPCLLTVPLFLYSYPALCSLLEESFEIPIWSRCSPFQTLEWGCSLVLSISKSISSCRWRASEQTNKKYHISRFPLLSKLHINLIYPYAYIGLYYDHCWLNSGHVAGPTYFLHIFINMTVFLVPVQR